jgi:hypothetical protein
VIALCRSAFLYAPWKSRRTTALRNGTQKIVITHPFSPNKGKIFFIVDETPGWGEDRLLCCDCEGNSQIFLKSWTDYPTDRPENPFEGKIDFGCDDLQMLARLISDIKRM